MGACGCRMVGNCWLDALKIGSVVRGQRREAALGPIRGGREGECKDMHRRQALLAPCVCLVVVAVVGRLYMDLNGWMNEWINGRENSRGWLIIISFLESMLARWCVRKQTAFRTE